MQKSFLERDTTSAINAIAITLLLRIYVNDILIKRFRHQIVSEIISVARFRSKGRHI